MSLRNEEECFNCGKKIQWFGKDYVNYAGDPCCKDCYVKFEMEKGYFPCPDVNPIFDEYYKEHAKY